MATKASMGGNPGGRDSRLGGLCGILTGILFVATFAIAFNLPASPSQADSTLASFGSLRSAFIAADILIGLAVVFAIPFYTELRNAFGGDDEFLIGAATLFSIVGVAVTAVVFIGETITLDGVSGAYAAGGISRQAAVVVAQAVIAFGLVVVFGFLLLAAGVALYGFVALRHKRFPRWLGAVGIVGAFLGLVGSVPVSAAFYAFIAGFVLILVWIFATSVSLWKPTVWRAKR